MLTLPPGESSGRPQADHLAPGQEGQAWGGGGGDAGLGRQHGEQQTLSNKIYFLGIRCGFNFSMVLTLF